MTETITGRAGERLQSALGEQILQALNTLDISEIMANADGQVFVESNQTGLTSISRISGHKAENVIRTMAKLLNQDIEPQCPIVSGKIPLSGARFEGLLPPLVENPCFCIRSHHALSLSFAELREAGMLTESQCEALTRILTERSSLIVCGPTGCGKTTLLNACLQALSEVNPALRIVSIEDTGELKIPFDNHVALHVSEKADMGMLLKSSLRLRPDLLVVGEVRGSEALDLIDAMTTGHSGLCTVHAGSVEQALKRLSLLVSRHPQAPAQIDSLVGEAVQYVALLSRDPKRRLHKLAQVEGFSNHEFKFTYI